MRKLMLGAVALVGALGAETAQAQARPRPTYADLFVFGDSLVDSGNARAARLAAGGADPAPPAQGYFDGRFSNGYNFADYLSLDLFGRPATAAAFGGTNFSVGGAQAAEVAGDASPSFAEQLGLFQLSGRTIRADSLVLVTLGGNDVRAQLGAAGAIPGYVPTLAPAVSALNAGLSSLIGFGARNILVTGLPDIGQIPAVTGLGSSALNGLGTQLSFGLNGAFDASVDRLAAGTGFNIQFFDLFAYQNQIYRDPAAFGVTTPLDTRRACLGVIGSAPACEGFVYFDPIHPTTDLHRAIADGLTVQALAPVPEPATWAMLIIGFGAAGGALRRRRHTARVAFA